MQHRSGESRRRWAWGGGLLLIGVVLGLLGGIVSLTWAGPGADEPTVITLTVGGPPQTLPPGTYQVGDAIIVVPVGGAAQVAVDATGAGIVRSVGANATTVTVGGVTATVPPGSEIAARSNPTTGRTDVVTLVGTATVQAGDALLTVPAGAGVGTTVNAATGTATIQATGTGNVTVNAIGTGTTTSIATAVISSGSVVSVDSTSATGGTITVAQGSAAVSTPGGGTTTVGAGQQVTTTSTATTLTTTTATTTPTIPAVTVPLPTIAGPGAPGAGGKGGGTTVPTVVAFRETPVSPAQ